MALGEATFGMGHIGGISTMMVLNLKRVVLIVTGVPFREASRKPFIP